MRDIDEALRRPAEDLAEEIRAGKWDHVQEPSVPATRCLAILEELGKRVPGFTPEQYAEALAYGLFATR